MVVAVGKRGAGRAWPAMLMHGDQLGERGLAPAAVPSLRFRKGTARSVTWMGGFRIRGRACDRRAPPRAPKKPGELRTEASALGPKWR